MINLGSALNLLDERKDVLAKVCKAILNNMPKALEQLNKALEDKDYFTACRVAHSIRGSARCIKADEVAATAEQIEKIMDKGNFEEAEKLWPDFINNVEQMMNDLKKELKLILGENGVGL